MKISSIILILILFLSFACSKNEPAKISYEQVLNSAKFLVYKADSTASELEKARLMVSEIPADAPEYIDGQELIKFIHEREILTLQTTPTPRNPLEKTQTDAQITTANENHNKSHEQLQNDSAENSQMESSNQSQANESQEKDSFDSKPVIFSETFSIKPNDMKALGFTFPATRNFSVQFDASGEDIECHIVSENDFQKLRDETEFKSFYSSGRVKGGKINLPMRGSFYLVFDNFYSTATPKTIKADFKALKK